MEDANKRISALLEEGESFTYENFSSKSEYGYPDVYVPAWVAWTTRVRSLLQKIFGKGSAPYEMLDAGDRVHVLGNDRDKFELAKSYFMGALEAALSILEEDTFDELGPHTSAPRDFGKRVFIVHGHDDAAKSELEVFVSQLGLEPVVLHREPDQGRTIIEKFEQHSDVGFAFVLLTPDEVAYLRAQEGLPDEKRVKEYRARPNVIFEFGYFVGRLGRGRVCCLHTGNVTMPSDLDGLLYKPFRETIEEAGYSIIRELQAAGYEISLPPTD